MICIGCDWGLLLIFSTHFHSLSSEGESQPDPGPQNRSQPQLTLAFTWLQTGAFSPPPVNAEVSRTSSLCRLCPHFLPLKHTHTDTHPPSLTPFSPSASSSPAALKNQKTAEAIKRCVGTRRWGDAVGTKLLHLQAAGAAGRQQPSHLGVINPYSPLAAFLPFTTYCLKLKGGGGKEGESSKKKTQKLRQRE